MPINSDAGPDQTPCSGTATVDMAGIVDIAQGGIWSGGSGSFNDNNDLNAVYTPTLLEISAGTFTLTLITTGNWGCPADTDYVNMTYLPDLIINPMPDTLVCEDATSVPLSVSTNPTTPNGYWSTPNGTGSFFPSDSTLSTTYLPTTADTAIGFVTIIFETDGNYGCLPKIDTMTISFGNDPIPDVTVLPGCTGDSILFTNNTVGAVSWLWEFGNGNTSTLENPYDESYNLPGNYDVTLTVQDAMGCTGSSTQVVTIYPTPVPAIFVGSVCESQYAQFTDISTVLNDTIISWDWDFDDGNNSNVQTPGNIFNVSGTYDVLLTVSTNHCSALDTFTVEVDSLPIININPSITQGCNMATVDFVNTTTNAIAFNWDFGDGTTSTAISPTHTYSNITTSDIIYNIEFLAQSNNGCIDTLNFDITIHPTPVLDITFDDTPGCSPLNIDFVNTTTGAASFDWDFGDGSSSTDTSPSYIFYNNNSYIVYYNVVLTAVSSYGCVDSVNNYITVYPNPVTSFNVNPDSSCSPVDVQFSTLSGQYSYEWFYGDGTSEMADFSTWHNYHNNTISDTTYNVQLVTTTSFNCIDTVENSVVIHPSPTAIFNVDTLNGCTPLTIIITNLSTGGSMFYWDYGDGNNDINNSSVFSHTYINNTLAPLNYTINLIAESANGCRDSITRTITVYPGPLGIFSASDSIGCSPLNIEFTNSTIGAGQYYWNFGDGNYSTNTHPTNTFINSGTVDSIYNVQLIGTSLYGCKDTTLKNITVHPQPEALFGLNNSSGCAPYMLEISNNSSGAINYYWDFGDGNSSTSSDLNIEHEYDNLLSTLMPFQVELIKTGVIAAMSQFNLAKDSQGLLE
jgi:PKD repeat protein